MFPVGYRRFLPVLLATALSLNIFLSWKDRDLVSKGYPDFTIFYSAGKIVRTGLAASLYDEKVQFRLQTEFAPDVATRHGALPYNHPPFEALLFVPFTFLPYLSAYLAWDLLNIALLGLAIYLLRVYVPALRKRALAVWVLILLAFFPVFVCLLQGQDMLVLLLLLVLAFVSLKKHQDFAAGCWLGLGVFRPHTVLPIALILLFARRSTSFLGFLASSFLTAAVSVGITGWEESLYYPKYVWHLEQVMGRGAIVPANMPNLRGFMAIVFRDGHPLPIALTLAGSGILLILGIRLFRLAETGGSLELAFSSALIIAVLVSYHAFIYDLSLLVLPILFIINADSLNSSRPGRWALTIPIALLFCSPLLMFLWLGMGNLNYFVPVLFLWLWGISRAISRLQAGYDKTAESA